MTISTRRFFALPCGVSPPRILSFEEKAHRNPLVVVPAIVDPDMLPWTWIRCPTLGENR
jgi:hypothetical protein